MTRAPGTMATVLLTGLRSCKRVHRVDNVLRIDRYIPQTCYTYIFTQRPLNNADRRELCACLSHATRGSKSVVTMTIYVRRCIVEYRPEFTFNFATPSVNFFKVKCLLTFHFTDHFSCQLTFSPYSYMSKVLKFSL